jgi:sucrose-phosphate synthase
VAGAGLSAVTLGVPSRRPGHSRLLAVDLDGTFLGDDRSMFDLWQRLDTSGVKLVFATGRHLESIESLYEQWGTDLRAGACVCMVGTEIWWNTPDGYRRDTGWDDRLSDGWDRAAIAAALVGLHRLQPQADEWQSQHKISFFVPSQAEATLVEQAIADDGHHVKVIWSSERFLDILPHAAGKGGAIEHVAEELGVARSDVAVAGDTGNDLDMMRHELGFNAIVVGNATHELTSLEGDHVYHATSEHAAGVTEGLAALGWLD